MNLTKTFTLYKLDDCTFTLDDNRSSRTLDKFGKTTYSVTDNENIWLNEEYERKHGTPTFILDVWLRYYKASELKKTVYTITTPVNELYRHAWGATPLVSLNTADKVRKAPRHFLKDTATLHETYWDNVLFNIHALESFKVRDVKKTGYIPGTKAETFHISDKERNGYTKKALHSFSIKDKQSKRLTIPKKEQAALTDACKRKSAWKRSPIEPPILVNDKARSTTKKAAKETVQMKERPVKAVFISPSEVVLIVDNVTAFFNWFRTVQESIKVADKRLIKTATLRKDAFSTKDAAKKAGAYKRYDSFTIADKETNGACKHAYDAFTLADGRRYDLNAVRHDSITVTPILAKRLAMGFSETFGIMSKYMSHAQPLYTEQAVTFTDDEKKLLGIVRNEMVNITEIYWDNALFLVHIADNINVSDTLRKTAEVQLYDSFRFLDHLRNGAGVNSYEDVSVAESGRRMIEKSLYDSLNVLDELRKDIRRIMLEKVAAMDSMSRVLDVVRKDTVNVAEVAAKGVRFPLCDTFHITDDKRKAIIAAKIEKFSMIDTIVKKTLAVRHDSFTISDEYRKMWRTVNTLREELKVLDKMARDIYHTIDDRLTIADGILKRTEHRLKDSLSTEESLNTATAYYRGFQELAKVGDIITRDVGKNPAEDIAVYDAFVRASNSYIESLQVISSANEAADFTSMSDTPPLYEQFTDFNVGDYEYEKAMLRLKVVSHATQAQPLLYDVAPHVDIDDTDDRGQVEITDTTAATKVHYNKHYYNAPEVQVTVRGGNSTTSTVPNILTTDGQDNKGRYFEIELLNSSGNRTTGIVSWVAKGW